jgi:hypothetical protein
MSSRLGEDRASLFLCDFNMPGEERATGERERERIEPREREDRATGERERERG